MDEAPFKNPALRPRHLDLKPSLDVLTPEIVLGGLKHVGFLFKQVVHATGRFLEVHHRPVFTSTYGRLMGVTRALQGGLTWDELKRLHQDELLDRIQAPLLAAFHQVCILSRLYPLSCVSIVGE